MTVSELIKELKKHNPDANVMLHHSLMMKDFLEDFFDQGGTCQLVNRVVDECDGWHFRHPQIFIYSRFQK